MYPYRGQARSYNENVFTAQQKSPDSSLNRGFLPLTPTDYSAG
jgi:hypothetical protein